LIQKSEAEVMSMTIDGDLIAHSSLNHVPFIKIMKYGATSTFLGSLEAILEARP
jgi:hypothetical protein